MIPRLHRRKIDAARVLRAALLAVMTLAFLGALTPIGAGAASAHGASICHVAEPDAHPHGMDDCGGRMLAHVGCVGHAGHSLCAPFLLPADPEGPLDPCAGSWPHAAYAVRHDTVLTPSAPPPKPV